MLQTLKAVTIAVLKTHFCCLVTKSRLTLCNLMDYSLPGSSPWDFPGKNVGSCRFLLQGIFSTHGSNPPLLHWQADSFTTLPPGKPVKSTDSNIRTVWSMQTGVFFPRLLWIPFRGSVFLSLIKSVISTLNYFTLEN